jgi:hypothetical protein
MPTSSSPWLIFSLQRALLSELVYLALARFLTLGSRGYYVIYVVVGVAMLWAARSIRGGRLPWHFDLHRHHRLRDCYKPGIEEWLEQVVELLRSCRGALPGRRSTSAWPSRRNRTKVERSSSRPAGPGERAVDGGAPFCGGGSTGRAVPRRRSCCNTVPSGDNWSTGTSTCMNA